MPDAYTEYLKALSPSARRRAVLHRGTKNDHLPAEMVVLPDGWSLRPGTKLPETVLEVGWTRYHILRVTPHWMKADEPEGRRFGEEAFPPPEHYTFVHTVNCHRHADNSRGSKKSKRKAKRKLVEMRDFALLYVYVRLDGEPVESEYVNWW